MRVIIILLIILFSVIFCRQKTGNNHEGKIIVHPIIVTDVVYDFNPDSVIVSDSLISKYIILF